MRKGNATRAVKGMSEGKMHAETPDDDRSCPISFVASSLLGHAQKENKCLPADLSALSNKLREKGFLADARLVDAIWAGIMGEAYDVNEGVFQWLTAGGRRLHVNADYEDHRVWVRLDDEGTSGAGSGEVSIVERLVREYCGDVGREQRLAGFMEGCVLAIVRVLGREGRFALAEKLLLEAAEVLPNTIHMRAAKYTVSHKLRNIGVAAHLEKFAGDDNGALADRFCEVPFGRMDIDGNGDVRVCCAHWVPTTIGNVFNDSTEEILNSDSAKKLRKSVVDGSFKYCNHVDCELIANNKLRRKCDYAGKGLSNDFYDLSADRLEAALHGRDYRVDRVSYVVYGLDPSCNLSCPSCRHELVMATDAQCKRLMEATETTVMPLLRQAKRIMINAAGEPFVSRSSRLILERLNRQDFPGLKVDIITNGTVCTREEWKKLKNLEGMIDIIRVSTDAATQGTFVRLRRGARYQPFIANMLNLAEMHRQGFMNQFYISFTYQIDNYLEMEQFVAFGRWLGVDAIVFECLQNLGTFSPEEYNRKAVHLVSHPEFPVFREIAAGLKKDASIYIDFDPGGDVPALPLGEKLMRGLFSRFDLDLDLVMRTATAARVDASASFTADVDLRGPREEHLYLRNRISLIREEAFLQKKLIHLESTLQIGLMVVGGLPKGTLSLEHIDLGRDGFFGIGWGRAEINALGQPWRWLFGGQKGRSTVYGLVQADSDFSVRLKIHDAPIDEYLLSLRLEVHDKPVREQYVENRPEGIFHVAKLTRDTVGHMEGWLGLTYTTSAPPNALPGEKGISASLLEVRPLR